MRDKQSVKGKIIVIFLAGTILFSLIHLILAYKSTEQAVLNALRAEAVHILTGISRKIDPEQYKRILTDLRETDDYWALRDQLNEIRQTIGAMYLITLRIDERDDKVYYVVDGWGRGDDKSAPINTEATVFQANDLRRVIDGFTYQTGLIHDPDFGEYFSVFVPIRDGNDQVIGILEMDMAAEEVGRLIDQVWYKDLMNTIILDVFLMMFFLAVTIWFLRLFEGYNRKLELQAEELGLQRDKLTDLNQLKDQILANTSHELRTPINGIIGLAETLLDGVTGPMNEKAKENLQMIAKSGHRLNNLVNDILDFSKMRKSKIELQIREVNIGASVEHAFTLMLASLHKTDVKLINQVRKHPVLLAAADENRLQQILQNLLTNSIKFTERGEIVISAGTEGSMIRITVWDSGIGIPKDRLPQVFEYFEQLDASIERKYGGTGLGLAITKQLVELMGGTVEIDSEYGKWTRVSFTLPDARVYPVRPDVEADRLAVTDSGSVALPSAELAETDSTDRSVVPRERNNKHATAEKPRILVVDDEPVNIQVLENLLLFKGFDVISDPSGLDAIVRFKQGEMPDLVLLDVMMPGMSGFDTAKQLRTYAGKEKLPIIMLTAKDSEEDKLFGFEAGANDYITKPFLKQELLARIRLHLEVADSVKKIDALKNRMKQMLDERSIVMTTEPDDLSS